jgi:O-antigen/teichoic acid export membrane protein
LQVTGGANSAKDVSITLFQSLITRAADFIYIAILARLLISSELGFYFMFRTIVVLVATTICLGLPISLARSTSMHLVAERYGSVRGTAQKAFEYSAVSGFTIAIVLFVIGEMAFSNISTDFEVQSTVYLLSLNVVAQVFSNNMCAILTGLRKFSLVAYFSIASVTIRTIPGLLASYYTHQGISALVWWFFGDLFIAASFIVVVSKIVSKYPLIKVSLKVLLGISLPVVVSYYINSAYQQVERFMILFFSNIVTVAIYSIASTLCTAFTTIYSSFSSGLFPTLSQYFESGGTDSVLRLSHRISRISTLLYFPLVTLGLVGAPFLISLVYSDVYLSAYPIFIILLLGTLPASLSTSLSTPSLALGKAKLVMIADCAGFSLFLLTSMTAGLTGFPSLTIALARVLMVLFTAIIVYLKLEAPPQKPIDTRYIGLLFVLFIVSSCFGLMITSAFPNYFGLLVSIVGIAVIYLIAIKLFQLLDMNDVLLFVNLIPPHFRKTALRIGKILVTKDE